MLERESRFSPGIYLTVFDQFKMEVVDVYLANSRWQHKISLAEFHSQGVEIGLSDMHSSRLQYEKAGHSPLVSIYRTQCPMILAGFHPSLMSPLGPSSRYVILLWFAFSRLPHCSL